MFITDVLVELGFVDKERAQLAVEEARGAGPHPRVDPGRAEGDRLEPALARGRRALWPLPPRPEHLQGRHGRLEPDLARRRPPLQRGSGGLHARRHGAARDVRPLRRDRDRRRPDDHGVDLPGCGCGSRGHRSAYPPSQHARHGGHRGRRGGGGGRGSRDRRTSASPPTTRPSSSSSIRSSGRRPTTAPRTCTSSRWTARCGFGSASTAS